MKKILLFLFVTLQSMLWATPAAAADCVQASLASYTALGSGGCTINGFRFSDFALLQRPNDTTGFSSIRVVPVIVGTTVVGIDLVVGSPVPSLVPSFTAAQEAAPSATVVRGQHLDDLIAYRVTGAGPSLNAASLFLNGYEVTGDASVTGIENLCLNGTFLGADGVSNCSGGPSSAPTLVVADEVPDMTTFLPRTFLSVVTDVGLDSGPDATDTSALTSVSNRFTYAAAPSVVPEPAPIVLLSVGLVALMATRRGCARRSMAT